MLITIAPDVQLFIDIEGAGWVPDGPRLRQKPTLILLHGGPGYDHSSFKPLFSQLADVAQIVYVDHRGHGRGNRRPAEEWTLDTFADDVVRLCALLGIEKPVVLGQSFGGFVAQRYLARHPAHPAKVVLSSTAARFNLDRKLAMFERLGGPAARAAAEAFWTAPGEATWAAYQAACMHLYNPTPGNPEARQRNVFNEDILYTWSAREFPVMDLRPGLAAAQCPVLVMAGALDPVTPIDDAREIFDALPAAHRQWPEFAQAGHGASRDMPEAAMATLRIFLQA